MSHADRFATLRVAHCRGIRRIDLPLIAFACEQAPIEHIKGRCAWLIATRKKSLTEMYKYTFCQGRINLDYPRCHLDSCTHALSKILPYLWQLTYALTSQNTLCQPSHTTEKICYQAHHPPYGSTHLTAPSAVHLPICFSPGSQLPRLSVEA